MAKKKHTTQKKRKVFGKKHTTKRKRKKSKGFLAEIVSHEGLKKTGKNYMGGFAGGLLAVGIDAILPANSSIFWRVIANAGVAVVAGAGFDAPSISAGMGGVTGFQLGQKFKTKLLSEMEEAELADEEALSQYPDALSEDGTPLYMADDSLVDRGLAEAGEVYSLQELEEMELAEAELSEGEAQGLGESFQDRNMYPHYINASMF